MGIFDSLPNPAAPGQAFQAGMRTAQQEREEREVRGALTAYALNPDDETAFERLAQWRPDMAISVRADRDKRQQAAAVADLQRRAAGGDRTALAELAGIDLDAWDKLADNDRQAVTERATVIGQAALRISQLPPDQRPAAWDAAIDQLAPRFPEVAEFKGKYSEEALMSAIDSGKLVTEFTNLSRPSYQVVPEGGTLVNTRDPAALSQVAQQNAPVRVTTPAEAQALPPGTRFVDPNGVERIVPGGAGGNASGGFRPVGIPGEQVTSTRRTPARNRAVGGVPNSFHLSGQARDSVPPSGMSMDAYYRRLKALNPTLQVINEGDHVHIEPRG